jgi:hypothetical protein
MLLTNWENEYLKYIIKHNNIKHRCLKNESLLMFIDRPSYNNDDHINDILVGILIQK